jgi:N-acylneuraminate cytidylyltransferase
LIAIIPARGGSKRIPRKNIRLFLGKPIIAYSIEAALQSGLFETVMVSTDDKEIADIALQYGASVPFLRSEENANDFAGTFEVIKEVLDKYEKSGQKFEKACCIYPCAPFVNVDLLNKVWVKLENSNFDSVFPIIRYSTPIQRALKLENAKLVMFDPQFALTRSQDLEPAFYDAGMFYWFNTQAILEKGRIMTDNCSFIEIDEMASQDIDNLIDWEIAEFKYGIHQKNTTK